MRFVPSTANWRSVRDDHQTQLLRGLRLEPQDPLWVPSFHTQPQAVSRNSSQRCTSADKTREGQVRSSFASTAVDATVQREEV